MSLSISDEDAKNHLLFNYYSSKVGFISKYCLRYKYLPNDKYLNEIYDQTIGQDNDIKPNSFDKYNNNFPFERLPVKKINEWHDPESLNDQDIDELFASDEEDFQDDNNKMDQDIEVKPMHVLDNEAQDLTNQKDSSEFIYTYLLVSSNGFHFAGNPVVTQFREGINDSAVINVSGNRQDDIVLVAQSNGMLLSVLPTKVVDNNLINRSVQGSTVIQYWDLGVHDNWKIVKNDNEHNNNNFVLVGYETKILKFFHFKDAYTFTLVNNLILDNYIIQSCGFFIGNIKEPFIKSLSENENSEKDENLVDNNPLMLFVPTVRFDRLVYLCIEWTSDNPYHKKVHQLTYQKGETINGIIPLQNNKVLTFANNTLTLILANQIMSGETSFITKKVNRQFRGIKSWFPAPVLLKKLQKLNPDEFNEFNDCTVVSSATGTIFACLTNETNIELYALTRFKGLTTISPKFFSYLTNISTTRYELMGLSFNRLIDIDIDISTISGSSSVTAYQNVISRETKDVGSDNNTEIAVINGNTWLFSNSSISQISDNNAGRYTIPYMKLKEVVDDIRTFSVYNKIDLFDLQMVPAWRIFLGIDFPLDSLILIGSNSNDILDLYLVQVSQNNYENDEEFEFINLEGILEENTNHSRVLFCAPYLSLFIYVDDQHVSILSVDSGGIRKFTPEFKIEGIAFSHGTIIIWNTELLEVWCCLDIKNHDYEVLDELNFVKCSAFTEVLLNSQNEIINFYIDKHSNIITSYDCVVLTTSTAILSIKLLEFYEFHDLLSLEEPPILKRYTLIKDFVILDDVYVYLAEGNILQSLQRGNIDKRSAKLPILPLGPKDVQIRKYSSSSILAFTVDEAVIIHFKNEQNQHLKKRFMYKLKLPYLGKQNIILDIQVQEHPYNPAKNKLYILFSNGLKILEPNYFSWIHSNYLLKYTRSNNKKFLYISNINRLLVVNYDYNDWYCIKLENGKILNLNNDVFEKQQKLINVIDASEHFHMCPFATLILNYEYMIKIIKIVSHDNRIGVEPLWTINFDTRLSKDINITPQYIYLLKINARTDLLTADSNLTSEHSDSIIHLKYDTESNSIKTDCEINFSGQGKLKSFQFFDSKYAVFSNMKCDRLFIDRHNTGVFEPSALRQCRLPPDSYINKIVLLDECCYVIALRVESRAKFTSKLVFFCTEGAQHFREKSTEIEINKLRHSAAEGSSVLDDLAWRDDMLEVYNEVLPQTETFDRVDERASVDSNMRGLNSDITPAELADNYNVEKFEHVPKSSISVCNQSGMYQVIDLDKAIKDVVCDRGTGKLIVLLVDQSLVEFSIRPLRLQIYYDMEDGFSKNSGYYIPSRSKRPVKTEGKILTDIDRFGRIWK